MSKVGSNASSSAIVIESSDGTDEEVIEDDENFGDTSHSLPVTSLHENSANNVNECTNNQSSSSDEENIDNVEGDVNINMSVFSNGDCMCRGCTDLSFSHQPRDVNKSKLVHSHKSKEKNCKKTYCRNIQSSWYEKHPWITVCLS